MTQIANYLLKAVATVSYLPAFSGDGYGYGGGVVLTVGDLSQLLPPAPYSPN